MGRSCLDGVVKERALLTVFLAFGHRTLLTEPDECDVCAIKLGV